jgi:hypothetical protein
MRDNLSPEAHLQMVAKDRIVDQIPIIHGCIQLVLLRYPGDSFLNECMGGVLQALDRLADLVFEEEEDTQVRH